MAETNEYLNLGVNIDARIQGANETIQMVDKINERVRNLQRTVSDSSAHNAGLTSSDTEGMMKHVVDSAHNVREELDGSRSAFSDLASFGATLSKDFSSISTVLDGQNMLDLSNKSYGDLSKLYEQYSKEVQKFKEAVNVSVISHELYTLQQLDELAKQEDVVKEKMDILRESLQQMDNTSNTMSFAQFSELNKDLDETQQKLRDLYADRNATANIINDALRNGSDADYVAKMKAGMDELDQKIISLESHAAGIQHTMETAGAYWQDPLNVEVAKKITSALETEEKALNSVHRAQQRVLNASPADTQRSFARVFTQYEMAQKKLSEVEMAMQSVGDAGEEAGTKSAKGFSDFAKAIDKAVKSGWSSFLNTSKKELNGMSKAITNIRKSIADWHKDQKSIADQAKAMYNTFNSFWRMLKTRIKRKLVGAVFNDITGTIGEIARIEPRFNSAISGFIVSARTLGAQIIASFEPIASIVFPILSQLLDYLTRGAAELAQFISRATGNLQFIQATKGQFDYAASLDKTTSSTKKATKAAKEYKNTVMSFDQLHKLNGDDESALDEALGLEGVNLDHANDKVDAINELGDRLWKALNAHDFAGAGAVIGDAVNMGFAWLSDKFGWEKNAEKFSGWLQNIIDAVNGFISELDPEVIGKSIGDLGNVFIHLFEQWTDPENGFDYREFGRKLGGILGNAVKTADWDVLGEGLVQGIQGTVNTVNGFMETRFLNEETGELESIFAVLGHALSGLLGGMIKAFSPSDWAELISGLVNGFFEFLAVTFSDPAKAEEFGHKLAQTINETINKLDAGQMTEGINAFTKSFTTLVETAFGDIDFSSAWSKFKEILGGLDWGDLAETIGIVFAPAFLSGLGSAIGSLLKTGGSALLMKYVFSHFMGGGAGAGAGGAAAGAGGVVGFFAGVLKFGMTLAAIYTAVKGIHTIIELKRNPEKVADDYAKKTQAHKDDPQNVQQAGGITLGVMKGNVRMPTFGELMDQIFQRNYTLEKAEQMGRTRDASLGYDPSNPQSSSGLGNLMAMALNPVMEKFVAPKLQEIIDGTADIPETALSNTDSDAFATTLIDGVAEATALPTDSVAGQNSEEFRTFLSEDFRGTVMEAAMMLAKEIADKDFTVELDRQVLAKSMHSYDASQNKRYNTQYAF